MSFLPRDFVETAEGLIFAVVAPGLDDGKLLAFLRYAPIDGQPRKVATDAANALLESGYPQYLHYSQRLDARLHAVPLAAIATHHRPRERLAALMGADAGDAIEAKLKRLISLLAQHGIPSTDIGVTGSLLIGRQNPSSDLDLVVYDRALFHRARLTVRELVAAGELQDLDACAWSDAYARRGCELDLVEFQRHERRKGNKAMIDGTKFDLSLTPTADDADGVMYWRKTGTSTLRMRVTDDRRAFDHPARYAVDHPDIGEVLSFTHTYAGQALTGETIEVRGAIERSDGGRRRLVVGSSREAPDEYIRVLWDA